jgi:hypothetical protein
VFNLELFVLFVERVYGSVETLQVFPVLAHHVFGMLQEFRCSQSAGMHGAKYTPAARSVKRSRGTEKDLRFLMRPGIRQLVFNFTNLLVYAPL